MYQQPKSKSQRRPSRRRRANSQKHSPIAKKSGQAQKQSARRPFPTLPKALEQKLWDVLKLGGRRPSSLRELAERLELSMGEQRAVRSFLKAHVRTGRVLGFRRGRFALNLEATAGQGTTARGSVIRHPDGYGFVKLEDSKESLFVPAQAMNGAIHGDVVKVMRDEKRFGAGAGAILGIEEPFSGQLLGQIVEEGRRVRFVPDDHRYPAMMLSAPVEAEHMDAWALATIQREAKQGRQRLSAKIVRHLDVHEGPEMDLMRSVIELDIEAFPPEVLREAKRVAKVPSDKEREGRLDLRDVSLVTIDGEDARDFDDAVCWQRRPGGIQRLIVAVADVAHYVRAERPLDEEAYRRGTSVYFPASCTPMLPENLSNGICSLRPMEERLCMAVVLDYRRGKLVKTTIREAVMCSHARLTYQQVAALLDSTQTTAPENPALAFRTMLEGLYKLTQQFQEARQKRGSLNLDLPAPKVVFDEAGHLIDVVREPRLLSHLLIEECMLQANEAVAKYLQEHKIPGVYRIHEEPDEAKLKAFTTLLHNFGVTSLPKPEPSVLWDVPPTFFAEVMVEIEEHPAIKSLHQSLLRTMKQARYTAENEGHYGLGLADYLHFTSPIRRYPDLIVHRLLKAALHNALPKKAKRAALQESLEQIGEQSSDRERKAMDAERRVLERYRARLMMKYVGEEFEGTITALAPFGLFVELDQPYVDGLVHARTWSQPCTYDAEHLRFCNDYTGEVFRIGDRVRVRVVNASPHRGQVDLALVESPQT